MRKRRFMILIIIGLLLTGAVSRTLTLAQEDEYNLADTDVFGKLRRPLVKFSHAIHSDNLMDTGCGICHHNPDSKTGKLVYIEGEELSCRECHDSQKEDDEPALREAFHGSCTVCHRDMIKTDNRESGPTTCGGCHKKS